MQMLLLHTVNTKFPVYQNSHSFKKHSEALKAAGQSHTFLTLRISHLDTPQKYNLLLVR